MAWLLSTSYWIGISLLAFFLALLVLPFHVEGEGVISEHLLMARFRLRWAFGLIGIKGDTQSGAHLYLCGLRTFRVRNDSEFEKRKQKKKKKKQKARKRQAPLTSWFRWFRTHAKTMLTALQQLFGAFHLQGRIYGLIGTGDPSQMAMFDLVRRYFPPSQGSFQVDIWPDYVDENIDLTFDGKAWVVLVHFLYLPLYWLVQSDTRQMIFQRPKATKVTSAGAKKARQYEILPQQGE